VRWFRFFGWLDLSLSRQAFWLILAVCALACPGVALAHSPIPNIGLFYSGVLHPLRVTEQALALLALAALMGQAGLQRARPGVLAMLGGFVVGLPILMGELAWSGHLSGNLLLVLAGVTGCCVAMAHPMRSFWLQLLAFLVAAAVMADSVQEGVAAQDFALATVGVPIGATLAVVFVARCVELLRPAWARIGVRIAGSWFAAASLMVLALNIRTLLR
jgi:hypothetical protein